ncbi:MAG: ATP synthase F1 subunit gamma [bacterium]|nr:ATP synthase F1 subunit gamma [bacterium]
MSSLLEIKKKIKATKGTKKITKAMQLVAASKMKTFQKRSLTARDFTERLLAGLRLTGKSLDDTRYGEVRESGKTLFVLMTSDKGLCGSMNTKLIRSLWRSDDWKQTPEHARMLITVGKKAAEAARIEGVETAANFTGLKEQIDALESLKVIEAILTPWETGEVKRVVLVASEYVNPFVFHVRSRTFLPLRKDGLQELFMREEARTDAPEEAPETLDAAFFEPGPEQAAETLAEQTVQSLFLQAFLELKATEYSSRMVAMKKATEAADDRIKTLTNLFNKARQASITQQLSELASANEAMSSENQYEIFEV